MKLLRYFFLLLLIIAYSTLYAQYGTFKKFGIEDGLVQSQVSKTIQDQRDFLFIATFGGVAVFDGAVIEPFSDGKNTISNMVYHLHKTKNNTIWFATKNGLSYFDGKSINTVKCDASFLSHIEYRKFVFYEYKNELYLYDKHYLAKIVKDSLILVANTLGIENGNVDAVFYNNKFVVFNKQYGMIHYNLDASKIQDTLAFSSSKNIINLLCFESENPKAYLQTNNQIVALDIETGKVGYSSLPTMGSEEYIYTYFKDSKGGEWYATNKGGVYFKKDNDLIYYDYKNDFSSQIVIDINEDNQGNIWLGTNGGGVYRFKYGPFNLYTSYKYFDGKLLHALFYSSSAKSLFLTSQDFQFYEISNGNINNIKKRDFRFATYKISESLDGHILLINHQGEIVTYRDGKIKPYAILNNYANQRVTDFKSNGSIQVALVNDTLYYHKRNEKWKSTGYFTSCKKINIINDSAVILIKEFGVELISITGKAKVEKQVVVATHELVDAVVKGDLLCMSTINNGVTIYNLNTKSSKCINSSNGLGCNFVYSILLQDSILWMSTGCGLDFINILDSNAQVVNYSAMHGLPKFESTEWGMIEVGKKIFLITSNGLLELNPSHDFMTNYAPKIILKRLLVFSKNIDLTPYSSEFLYNGNLPNNPTFPSHFTHLTFDIKAVILGVDQIKYKYQLLGGEDENIYELSQPPLVLSNLSSGKYRLRLWSTNSMGQWGKEESLYYYYDFEILTPFYKTLWARIAIVFVVLATYFFIRYYLYKLKLKRIAREEELKKIEQDKVKQRTAEDFHDEIGNKLTKINLLSSMVVAKTKNQSDVVPLVSQLQTQSQSLYKGAKDIIWSLQPQSNYLHQIVDRMVLNAEELLQLAHVDLSVNKHFPENIDWEKYKQIKLDDEVSRNLILICKEIFNNITKYASAAQVKFDIYVNYNSMEFKIVDDGCGFDINAKKDSGNGLSNMARRAHRIHASLDIQSELNKGTAIALLLKFSNNLK
jgi:signal transduction histidine kinase